MKYVFNRIKFFHKKGDWTPLIPYPFRAVIMFAWCVLPVIYGIDYLHENPSRGVALSVVESMLPLYMWGLVLIFGGASATISMLMRWRLRAVVSLHILGALWATLAWGLLIDSIQYWGGDGFRGAAVFTCIAVQYWGAAAGYYSQKSWIYSPMIFVNSDKKE